jgi:hypothetical protein
MAATMFSSYYCKPAILILCNETAQTESTNIWFDGKALSIQTLRAIASSGFEWAAAVCATAVAGG